MQAFHLLGPAPFYTNSFLLISDAGHAVIIDPAAEVQEYDKTLINTIFFTLLTHGPTGYRIGQFTVMNLGFKPSAEIGYLPFFFQLCLGPLQRPL